MSFLPDNYEVPLSNSSYMKFKDGENRLRILSVPIFGWEDWTVLKKPIRFRMNAKPDKPVDPLKPIKHFWAMIVWNYGTSKIEILEVTQVSILKRFDALSRDSDWGDPFKYDIKVFRSEEKGIVKYVVNPCPAKDVTPEVKEAFAATPIDLEELFRSGDPFKSSPEYHTKAFWEVVPVAPVKGPVSDLTPITAEQAGKIEEEVSMFIDRSAPEWRPDVMKYFKISSFKDLPSKSFELVMKKLEEKKMKILDDEVPF